MAEPGPPRSIMLRLCLCAQVDLQFLDEVISGGADPNCSDRYGQTVLHEVTPGVQSVEGSGAEDPVPALCVLLSADPSAQTFLDQQTPLHYAAKNDAVRSIKLLLRAGANIGCTDYKQRTPLQLAASMERSEAAQVLLELGANAGVKDSDGQLCISALIGRMSHVAQEALRQFHVKDRVTRQEYFYLNLLEPEEAGTPGDPSGSRASPSLQVVVLEGKLDLIMNPVFLKLIEIKWKLYGRRKLHLRRGWMERRFQDDLRCSHPMWPQVGDVMGNYSRDCWNIFDWLVYSLLMASFCAHLADVLQPSILLHTLSLRLFSISIIFLWLRLMKHVRAFRLMGPFIVMLGNIVGDVMRFLFLYAEIFIPYACSFWIIFGGTPSVPSMQSVSGLLYSLYRITLVDEYEYAAMVTVDNIMAPLLCGTFLAASSILCVNLLIALLSDTFQRVHDNSQANAVMQQAAVILQVGDSMPRLHRFYDNQYISKHCSPLGEACDNLSMSSCYHHEFGHVTGQVRVGILLQVQENHELQVLPIQESQTPQEQKLQGPKKHRNQGQESLERQNQQVQDPKNLQQELQAIQTELKELRSLVQQLLQIRNDFV
uniref:Ion transport domain-containing protein n=1 Tax=Poecilia mexicana TaxID=48701 RepID=A0A3B3X8U6_9TELE